MKKTKEVTMIVCDICQIEMCSHNTPICNIEVPIKNDDIQNFVRWDKMTIKVLLPLKSLEQNAVYNGDICSKCFKKHMQKYLNTL